MTTAPKHHDSVNRLLYKWALSMSNSKGGIHAPRIADSNNNLLRKILLLLQAP